MCETAQVMGRGMLGGSTVLVYAALSGVEYWESPFSSSYKCVRNSAMMSCDCQRQLGFCLDLVCYLQWSTWQAACMTSSSSFTWAAALAVSVRSLAEAGWMCSRYGWRADASPGRDADAIGEVTIIARLSARYVGSYQVSIVGSTATPTMQNCHQAPLSR